MGKGTWEPLAHIRRGDVRETVAACGAAGHAARYVEADELAGAARPCRGCQAWLAGRTPAAPSRPAQAETEYRAWVDLRCGRGAELLSSHQHAAQGLLGRADDLTGFRRIVDDYVEFHQLHHDTVDHDGFPPATVRFEAVVRLVIPADRVATVLAAAEAEPRSSSPLARP